MATGEKPDVFSLDPLKAFSEGQLPPARNFTAASIPKSTFKRMVVLEAIPDPTKILNNKKIETWRRVFAVSNMQFVDVLPRNTIIAQLAYSDQPPLFCFPFFPSHLALPCKPGEMVWSIIEDPEAPVLEIAYWMCKITEPHNADDVNHTHAPRSYDLSMVGADKFSKRERSQNDGATKPVYELRNGNVNIKFDNRVDDLNRQVLPTAPTSTYFEDLIQYTDAAKLSQYEAIPRFKKRPGDIVLEGSNNSLIVLGTDRNGSVGNYVDDPDVGPVPEFPETDFIGSAGSIDLVVGRGQTPETLGKEVSTTSIAESTKDSPGVELKKELGKTEDELSEQEGDVDYFNDRSRILISQRTIPDTKFSINSFNSSNFGLEDSGTTGDAAIILKTDKIRLIARSDIEILVTGFDTETNAVGIDIKKENIDTSKFAAIVIKANGDIIFRPSDTGYIKLGSDTADKALLCTDAPANPAQGLVTGIPITSTLGVGFIGTGAAGQGTWARKVLVD